MSQAAAAEPRPANPPVRKPRRGISVLIIVLVILLLLGGGVLIVWQNLFQARTQIIHFLQSLEPETHSLQVALDERSTQLELSEAEQRNREDALVAREQAIAEQEEALARRREAFESQQLDPASPTEQQAEYLAVLFSGLPPDKAAELLEAMEDVNQAVRILRRMDDEYVVSILASMKTPFGAEVSNALLGTSIY